MNYKKEPSDLEEIDFYQDVMNAINAWYLGWLRMQENFCLLYDGGVASTLPTGEEQQQASNAVPPQLNTSPRNEVESLSTVLKDIWIKHMDDEHELPTRRKLQKQRSISSLQESGVGSFDHLSGLTLEQLQEMERLVYDHDSNSCYGAPSNNDKIFASLEWLDNLCT